MKLFICRAILNGIRKADYVTHKQWHIFYGRFTKLAVCHNLTFVFYVLLTASLYNLANKSK